MSKQTASGLEQLKNLPDGPGKPQFLSYVSSFEEPQRVGEEIWNLIQSDDPLVAPPDRFCNDPGEALFENWDYPVNAYTFFQEDEGRLLCLPPGSERFQEYREIMPTVMDRQLRRNFPRLKSELANRPNLFFPGVFYPDEIHIANMEMISLNHGRNYVVQCDLNLEGAREQETVVLKPTPMGVEAVITSTLDELNRRMPTELKQSVGPIRVPYIVAVDDTYGILEYLPGDNGVEVLPNGINTGSIHTLRSNEYPEQFEISNDGLIDLADEFAKQAVCAFYLRLYDRKPDQFIFEPRSQSRYRISHIDFGRAIKKNYALPWKRYYATQRAPLVFEDHEIPYFEAAASLIFLPHFIPDDSKNKFPPFSGKLRDRMKSTFIKLARFFQKNTEVIREHFQYLIGENTQFNKNEVYDLSIRQEDVDEVYRCLLSLDPRPSEVFESVINLAMLEHEGKTPTEVGEGEAEQDSVYMRGLRPGGASRSLAPKHDGEHPYELKEYGHGGRVFYDRDRQTLTINFGNKPERVLEELRAEYSSALAGFIEQFPEIKPGVEVQVYPDGRSEVKIPPGLLRRDIQFPEEAVQQVRQVVSGFAPTHHVQNYIDDYVEWKQENPESDFIQEETKKETIVFSNSLEGKEILQSYQLPGEEEAPIHEALTEIIRLMLSNPEYLADKDPMKSINQLVTNLAQKHEITRELEASDFPDVKPLRPLFKTCREVYNSRIPTEHFQNQVSHHLVHVRSMLKLGMYFSEILDLTDDQKNHLLAAVALHDLNLMDAEF
ncbi:MAG: hypothetical protein ABEK50_08760, partial [bacterium]